MGNRFVCRSREREATINQDRCYFAVSWRYLVPSYTRDAQIEASYHSSPVVCSTVLCLKRVWDAHQRASPARPDANGRLVGLA